MSVETMIPVTEATVPLGLTREQLVRRIQAGRVRGKYVAGRWYVDRQELPDKESAGRGAARPAR